MTRSQLSQNYLTDLGLQTAPIDTDFLKNLQSKHIAQYSFNNLAVVLGEDMPLDIPSLFTKIVEKRHGGYCFEHNKLVFYVLADLQMDVRLLLAKVVHNQDIDVPRTHRITLLNFQGEDYIVDVGFGHIGARYPVKLEVGTEQDQGDNCYRIIENSQGEYGYQVFKDGDYFTLYIFDLNQYTEADCLLGHFYSHRHPDAVFVNNLVVCRKSFNDIRSLRNAHFHRIKNGETQITDITSTQILQRMLTQEFDLDVNIANLTFLFSKFIAKSFSPPS